MPNNCNEMAFLQKLFAFKRHHNEEDLIEFPRWSSPASECNVPSSPVRLLMLRDSDTKGKKLLFDSMTTIREVPPLPKGFKQTDYDQITDGIGYKYIHPSRKDTKQLGEMVFGTAPIANQDECFKVHCLENPDQQMWSVIFSPVTSAIDPRSSTSNQSLDSSYGSNLGSLRDYTKVSTLYSHSDCHGSSSTRDSGVFSSHYSYNSHPSSTNNGSLLSVPETGDYPGSESLDCGQKELDGIQNRDNKRTEFLYPPTINIVPVSSNSLKKCSKSNLSSLQMTYQTNHLAVVQTPKKLRSQVVLAVAVIIDSPPGLSHLLSEANAFFEDLLHKVKLFCLRAYNNRSVFIHLVYEVWREVSNDVIKFFTAPRLEVLTWHDLHFFSQKLSEENRIKKLKFGREFVDLKKLLDTKEKNFFFSTLLSAILTHHFGWALTCDDELEQNSQPLSENSDRFSNQFKCQDMMGSTQKQQQYLQLYGLIGSTNCAVKTVLVSEDSQTLKRLTFILTYFLRCSQPKIRKLHFDNSQPDQIKSQSLDITLPVLPNFLPKKKMFARKSSSSCLKSLAKDDFVDVNHSENHDENGNIESRNVVFVVGGHETKTDLEEERKMVRTLSGNGVKVRSVARRCHMKKDSGNPVTTHAAVIHAEFQRLRISESRVSPLPTLVCISDLLLPGCVLQGCQLKKSQSQLEKSVTLNQLKQSVRLDLRSSQMNSWLRGFVTEFRCIFANCDTGQVELHSGRRKSLAGSNSDVQELYLAPIVANLLDSVEFVAKVSIDLVIQCIEDGLRDIVKLSKVLSHRLLLSDQLANIETLSNDLGVDRMDIPLLMALASTHSPQIQRKYGISFLT